MHVREYTPTDSAACRSLWIELTQHHRDIYEAQTIGGDDPGSGWDEHLARVGSSNVWVAVDEGRVVGLTGLIDEDATIELEPLVVTASRRGEGIGWALAHRVISEARTRGHRSLSVRPVARNAPALAAFHSYGFTSAGHVELFMDLEGTRQWVSGAEISGISFEV